jgi:hypothetical protein
MLSITLRARVLSGALLLMAGANALAAETRPPRSKFYPFGETDLSTVRTIVKAERIGESEDINRAWSFFGTLKANGAPADLAVTIAEFDAFKNSLTGRELPAWFSKLRAAGATPAKLELATKIGDEIFERQKETPETQWLKAIAIAYALEIRLGREGAVAKAREHAAALLARTPWDSELRFIHAMVLGSCGDRENAWAEGRLALYLNPQPILAFVDSVVLAGAAIAPQDWPEIKIMIREAAEVTEAEVAIKYAERRFPGLGATTNRAGK